MIWKIRSGTLKARVEAKTCQAAFIQAVVRRKPKHLGELVAATGSVGITRYITRYFDPIPQLAKAGLMGTKRRRR